MRIFPQRFNLLPAAAALALAFIMPAAWAVSPHSIEENDYAALSQGELKSAALTSDGYLLPSYARRTLGDTGAEIVWDAVREPKGGVLCATGHRGLLMRISDKGTTRTLARLADPELTAMVRLTDGSTLIAGAPSGTIYRLATDDRLTTVARLQASFVWRMVQDASGDVWAATGSQGHLFRLRSLQAKGYKVEKVAKLNSANLLDLWIDTEGRMGKPGDLFVAGQDPGWVYRVTPSGKDVSVVFNAQAEEVRALVPFGEGLALALNTERAPTPQAISLTLRMSGGPVANDRPSVPGAMSGGGRGLEQAFAPSRKPPYGLPRSEIAVLSREGFIRQLWNSPERPINSLALSPSGGLLVAAGDEGRLFEVQVSGEFSVVADTREDYLVRIVPDDRGYLLTAGRNGLVFAMERSRADEAVFLSQALDARLPVSWGRFYVRGDQARGQKMMASFRQGNDGDVDSKFWSPWSKDQAVQVDRAVTMPGGPARFMQYRLKIEGREVDGRPPRVDAATLYYIEPNAAPMIREVKVTAAEGRPSVAMKRPAAAQQGAPAPAGADAARPPRSNAMALKIEWQARDPNGDALRYALYFKGNTEHEWKLIEDELTAMQLPIDIGGVADGRYRFRVVADDTLGNSPGKGLTAEKVSDEVTIDNTPPAIGKLTAAVHGKRALLRAEVADELSVISSANVDVDNGDTMPLMPVDGLLDQRRESFEWETGDLKPGEHVVTMVVTDAQGNSSVQKVVFSVEK